MLWSRIVSKRENLRISCLVLMLCDSLIVRVLETLADGCSRRSTARLCGVSRGIVDKVARGDRTVLGDTLGISRPFEGFSYHVNEILYSRCPGCGGTVLLPCQYCLSLCYRRTHRETKPEFLALF